MKSIVAVIPAAGQGKRMKSDLNKQYLSLVNKPVLAHTLATFEACELITKVILVAREDELEYCRQEVVDEYDFKKVKVVIEGGQTRQESVYNGLQAIKKADYVVVHDGARPLITEKKLQKAIKEVKKHDAVGIAVPVKDTIKKVDGAGFVKETPDRNKLWAIQTPQVFSYNLLLQAYEAAKIDGVQGTDSSMLVERLGHSVKLVEGNYENLKVTTPEDLIIAEAIVQRRT